MSVFRQFSWRTERRVRVTDFWIVFSSVIIIVWRLTRQAWTSYRWEGRPHRHPHPTALVGRRLAGASHRRLRRLRVHILADIMTVGGLLFF